MRLTWAEEFLDAPKLREQWNALVLGMECPEVFYTWEWAAAFVRAYGSSAHPWIATAYDGDQLVGVAALKRISSNEVEFLAGTTADYCDFVSLPERRKEFVSQVLSALREAGIRTLVLANLPADSATVAALKGNPSYKSFLRTGYFCAQVRLGVGEERRVLAETLLKKKMYRRSINTLQRIGPVTLTHDFGAGLRRGVIEKFCETHVARFLATGRISNLVDAQRREFLGELARMLAEQGWFDLMTLRASNWVIALNYGFRFRGSWFWYQPTIVNKFEELSPGYCLLTKIVEDAVRYPEVHMVDLGLGAEGYKERFANGQRTTLHATLSRSRIDLWNVSGHYRAAEAIKRRSGIESMARRAQTLVRGAAKRRKEEGWAHLFGWAGGRVRKSIATTDEVFLFQWHQPAGESGMRHQLVALTWEILSGAAMRYAEDGETMDYLLRSAARFRTATARGYALLGPDGVAQHLAWVTSYEGFAMAELDEILRAPSAASVMIFDCWTPRDLRGQGLYGRAISGLGEMLSVEGKDVWIFSAAANAASVAGIEKSGFQREGSLFRRKVLAWKKSWQESRTGPRVERNSPAIPDRL